VDLVALACARQRPGLSDLACSGMAGMGLQMPRNVRVPDRRSGPHLHHMRRTLNPCQPARGASGPSPPGYGVARRPATVAPLPVNGFSARSRSRWGPRPRSLA
jgi:hypothetical protein